MEDAVYRFALGQILKAAADIGYLVPLGHPKGSQSVEKLLDSASLKRRDWQKGALDNRDAHENREVKLSLRVGYNTLGERLKAFGNGFGHEVGAVALEGVLAKHR